MKFHLKLSKLYLLVIGIPLLWAGCSGGKTEKKDIQKGRSIEFTREVSFLNTEGEKITTIEVAIADDQNERNMGLMDVNELPSDKGMLFIFDSQQPLSFWMANTPLSLDIFFVNNSGEIVRIHQNTQPFSENNLSSGEPAKYVIETNSGFSISHDIQEGMRVVLPDTLP